MNAKKDEEKKRIMEGIRLEKLRQEARMEAQKELDEETLLRHQNEQHYKDQESLDKMKDPMDHQSYLDSPFLSSISKDTLLDSKLDSKLYSKMGSLI